MSLLQKIRHAFYKIQIIPQSNTQFCRVLEEAYEGANLEEFTEGFLKCLRIAMNKDIKNVYVEQILCFAATFCVHVARKASVKRTEGYPRSQETNYFLKIIIFEVLQMQTYRNYNVRFHVCNFISILFQIIGNEDLIEETFCNYVQEAMIDRLRDVKCAVRLKAIAAIFRLQDPNNEHCQVANAFLQCLCDPNVEIRKAIMEKIAPSKFTLPKLIECLGDISEKVRAAAFKKCSILPPGILKITQRQEVLRRGFEEESRMPKKAFIEVLFPKWLSYYDTNFLHLLKAIKLDADEDDIKETSSLGYNIMKEVFRLHPINTIISYLPINESKLIPFESLSSEMVLYWCAIHQHIISNDNLDEQLEKVVPELSPFCEYIESVLSKRDLNNSELNQWEQLENQFIIYKLFEMAGNFDFSDEVGRIKLHVLILDCLSKQYLTKPVVSTLIKVLGKLNNDANSLIEDVNELITNIFDLKKIPSLEYINERIQQLEKLKESIKQTSDQLDVHIKREEMKLAFRTDDKLKELIAMKNKIENEKYVCDTAHELFILNKCLDILICLLAHKNIKSVTPTLLNLKDTYLKDVKYRDVVIFRKVFNCLSLLSLMDFETAKESLNFMRTPILLYEATSNYDQETLLISIYTVTDLLKIHGPELFVDSNDKDNEYASLNGIIDDIINLLDDKHQKIREYAAVAISQLIYNGIMVTSDIFSRILLKWYHPAMETQNPKGQQLFGIAMEHFVKTAKNSDTVVVESVIPALNIISRAYVNITNIDNVIKFIAAITQLKKMEFVSLHNLLSFKLCSKILEDTEANAVYLYVKMLLSLQIPEEENVLNNLKHNIQSIIRAMIDVQTRNKLKKYFLKLEAANMKITRDIVSSTSSNPDDSQFQDNTSIGDSPQDNESIGDYIIEDTDESICTSPVKKRTLNASIILANPDVEDEDTNDILEAAVEQLQKRVKLVDENSNSIIENEDTKSVGHPGKRQSTSPLETDPEKKRKLASDIN